MNKEIWKEIAGYEGLYQISNHGRVKSLERRVKRGKNGFMNLSERILKPGLNKGGYLYVILSKEGIKNHRVHRLVIEAFLNKPSDWKYIENSQHNGYTVNHIDGIKTNNHVDNLEWATQFENTQHAFDNDLHNNPKIRVLLIELNLEFESLSEAARWIRDNTEYFEAGVGSISNMINGKQKTAYKYNWKAI